MKDVGLVVLELGGFEDEWYLQFDTCDQDFSDPDTHAYVALASFDDMCRHVLPAVSFGPVTVTTGGVPKSGPPSRGRLRTLEKGVHGGLAKTRLNRLALTWSCSRVNVWVSMRLKSGPFSVS